MIKLPWILLGLSILGIIYIFVLLLNAGVAIDDARSEVMRYKKRNDLTLSIVQKEWIGKKVASVIALSEEFERQGTIIGTEEGSLEIGDLIFDIEGDVVTNVRYID